MTFVILGIIKSRIFEHLIQHVDKDSLEATWNRFLVGNFKFITKSRINRSFIGVRGVASFGTAPVRQIQDPFRDIAAEAGASVQPGSEKRQELSRLYQPPNDLIYHGTFNEARQFAKANKLWLLINVQDEKEFGSHQLNRDTWSDDIVQSIVGSAFVFWQNYASSEDGSRYCQLYKIQPDRLPHIGILDPRTGEKIQEITGYVEPQLMAQKCT